MRMGIYGSILYSPHEGYPQKEDPTCWNSHAWSERQAGLDCMFFSYLCLAVNEGMERQMETTI